MNTTIALSADTLSGRAADALDRARRQDPGFDRRPCDVQRAITRRRPSQRTPGAPVTDPGHLWRQP